MEKRRKTKVSPFLKDIEKEFISLNDFHNLANKIKRKIKSERF